MEYRELKCKHRYIRLFKMRKGRGANYFYIPYFYIKKFGCRSGGGMSVDNTERAIVILGSDDLRDVREKIEDYIENGAYRKGIRICRNRLKKLIRKKKYAIPSL